MKRLSRFLPQVVLAGSLVVPAYSTMAQQAPAMAKPAEVDKGLKTAVEDFWHYAKIARYDLATAEANKILAHKDNPGAILAAFEKVSADRKDNLDQWLLRWQQVPELKDPVTQLIRLAGKGHEARNNDQAYIEDNIKRLNTNERAYQLAVGRLRSSGQSAVPLMLDYLRDPQQKQYHTAIKRALVDMGRPVLNPLVAAMEMKDVSTLTEICTILGDIGYEDSIPYLAKLANSQDSSPAVKSAAMAALLKMGAGDPNSMKPADLFYNLGEKFYYDNAAITADPRLETASMWYWSETLGLTRKLVPTPIFNELMAMRAAEIALKLDPKKSEAVSLWLASNYKREAELSQGATDPTRAEGQPSAHYYGVESGVQYLNPALARAVHDRNTEVALKIVKSLQQIAGNSNMFTEGRGMPLVEAMSFPDRQVRFEAAFAVASALPMKNFAGADRVVPLLAEALMQNGKAGVLVVSPKQDEANAIVDGLKKAGYVATSANSAEAAALKAATLPAVDAVVIFEEIGTGQIDQLQALSSSSPRLERAAKLVVTATAGSPYVARAANDRLMSATQSRDVQSLKAAIESARQKSGTGALDEKTATEYAMRAAAQLRELAVTRSPVLDISPAQNALLSALDDSRPELVKAAGATLALLNSGAAQSGLLAKAEDAKASDDVKISLYKSLASSAKFFGNHLKPDQVASLQKTVESASNLDVRSAAAEASGALNLPAEKARVLIVKQSKL